MIEINLNKINKNFGTEEVLKDISFELKTGEIVALIGDNGSGKTTILNIINEKNQTSGEISIRNNAKIAYLKQGNELYENIIVKDILYGELKEINSILTRLKDYEEKMLVYTGKKLDDVINKYSLLQEKFLNIGGYEIEEKIGKLVNYFKINDLINKNYNSLSGGEKRLINFVAILINEPDILLLDEPTNHLDLNTIEILEQFLKEYKKTVLLISHDRYFLDKVTNKILYLENGKIDVYYGNYSYFLREHSNRFYLREEAYKNQQKEIERMNESAKKLREFGRIADNERFFKRAVNIERRIDRLEKIEKPKEKISIPLIFTQLDRSGNKVITINKFNFRYNDKIIFKDANLDIFYQDKICIVSKNGSGKSTLINAIMNKEDGINIGSNVKIGYIEQDIKFEKNCTVLEYAKTKYIGAESILRSILYKFLFDSESLSKKIDNLSGGEKVRLKLFALIQENVNLLIFDEPTNHLDITTREILENSINDFKGTVIVISHDRYFINKIAKKIVYIENNKLRYLLGNYDDYLSIE